MGGWESRSHLRPVRGLGLVLLYTILTAPATALKSWTFSITSGASGSFSATESTGPSTISGSTSSLGTSSFLEFTVTGGSGANVPGNGTVKYGLEFPYFGFFSQSFLTAETKIVTAIGSGTCPTQTISGIFIFALWTGSQGTITDVSLSTTPAYGLFSWNPATNTVNISDVRNLSSHTTLSGLGGGLNLTGSCTAGKITLTGAGDRGGTVYLNNFGGGLYVTNSDRFLFVVPRWNIESAAKLNGTYSTWIFDESAITNVHAVDVVVSGGTSGTGDQLTSINPETTDATKTWALTNITINSPFTGAFKADLQLEGGSTRKLICAAYFSSTNFIYCAGQNPSDASRPLNFVMKSSASSYTGGTQDTYSFGANTGKVTTTLPASGYTATSALQADGKLLSAVGTSAASGVVYRYQRDGSLDTSFSSDGRADISGLPFDDGSVVSTPSGKVLVAGENVTVKIARLTTTGILDTSFGVAGIRSLTVGSTCYDPVVSVFANEGGLAAYGAHTPGYRAVLAKFTSTGALDTTFSSDGYETYDPETDATYPEQPQALAVDSAGKILVAGTTSNWSGKEFVFRTLSTGVLDTTFDTDGIVLFTDGSERSIKAMLLASSGKIYLGGSGTSQTLLYRLTSTGAYDTTFDSDGKRNPTIGDGGGEISGLAFQNDNKIIAAGYATSTPYARGFVARFNTDGVLDTTFNSTGYVFLTISPSVDEFLGPVNIQEDGKIVATQSELFEDPTVFTVFRVWP